MSFKSIFFKPIKNDVKLPEDVIEKVEKVDEIVTGEEKTVEETPVVAETVAEPVEEVHAVETVEDVKEVVEEAKDDLTGGVATLSEPDEDGFQEFVTPEVYDGEEVFEVKAVEEPVEEPIAEEPLFVVEEREEPVEAEENHIVAITEEKDMTEIELDEELSTRIHKIIEDHTKDAVKEIMEIIRKSI